MERSGAERERTSIIASSMTRKVEVDTRIPLRYYYRIADNLLKQASIYRDEKNIVDLYIILLRFSSLVSETIPFHQEYLVSPSKEKAIYKKKLLAVLDELESLKPEFHHRVDELNKAITGSLMFQLDGLERTSYGSVERLSVNKQSNSIIDIKRSGSMTPLSSWKHSNYPSHMSSPHPLQADKQFHKLHLDVPLPKKETLSRHSYLGPNGLQGQWLGPSTQMKAKVQYPSYTDFTPKEDPGLNQAAQNGLASVKDGNLEAIRTPMESALLLDDGRWPLSAEKSCPPLISESQEDPFPVVIRQPFPPSVPAQVQQGYAPISPSKVADPRPGPAVFSEDEVSGSNTYQHLHVPIKLMEDFLRLARSNTEKNLETCAILAGSLKNRVFQISTLIVPKQESTSDSCSTLNEEEIFEVQDRLSLFPLGWIHTHPSQTCFMSSVDLHTHYSYQIMLPEAIAIVMAPTDPSSPHGIFHLFDPSGVSVIRNCQLRGFHPHEEPSDGSPIYEHCSHVFMNPKLRFEVIDLR